MEEILKEDRINNSNFNHCRLENYISTIYQQNSSYISLGLELIIPHQWLKTMRVSNSQSVMSFFCFIAPHWFAFLYEGPDPLLSISQSQVVNHYLGGGGIRCISTLSHLSLEDTKERKIQHVNGNVCIHHNVLKVFTQVNLIINKVVQFYPSVLHIKILLLISGNANIYRKTLFSNSS